MRWQDPDTNQVAEISKDFFTEELARDFDRADPYFQRAVIVAEYAEILKESYWAEDSSLDDVYDEARRLEDDFHRDGDMSELVDLMKMARRFVD